MMGLVTLVGLALALQVPAPRAAEAEAEVLRGESQAIREREAGALRALADRRDAAGRKDEAEQVRGLIEPPPPEQGPIRFRPLPEVVPGPPATRGLANVPASQPGTGKDADADAKAAAEVEAIRSKVAEALFDLAVRSLSGTLKHYSLADQCLRAVLDRAPEHAEARRLLGYVPHDGGWATPFAAQRIRNGMVDHPTYGWVDASWVEHLDRGELPAPGVRNPKQARWLPAADADALRRSIERPWQIETEHFLILTNVPLSEAIAFGRKLEAFHDLFNSLLADVIADDLPMVRRFREKSATSPRTSLHTIYYIATRDEFVDYLRAKRRVDVSGSLGFYDPPRPGQRRSPAYFFRDVGGQLDVTATLYHEVSHQLLFESTSVGTADYRKNLGNFWVFEGLGTYFETLSDPADGVLEVGGFVGPRIAVAQERLLNRGEFVPIEQLVRLGQTGFTAPDRINLYYAEAMALTVFLMNGNGGRYREGFLDYVRDALRGRLRGDGARALDSRVGAPYATLDAEFLTALNPRNAAPAEPKP